MGGKPKSTSSSTSASGSAQAWATPYAQEGVNNVLSVYNANQPHIANLTGQANANLASLGKMGAAYGKTAGQGNAFTSDVIGGKYMSGNPYIRNIMGQMGEQILGDVGSAFSSAGRYGSGAYTGTLADSLGDAYSQLLYGNYSDEMNRRMAATGMANDAQAANAQQQLAQMALAAEIPYTGMNNMAQGLGALFSGGTEQSKSKSTGPHPIWGAIGSAMAAAGAAASDRRLKVDIVKVGSFDDGLGVYDFSYRDDPEGIRYRGVMADEVKELRPQAYIPNFDGEYDGVDYGKIAA